MKKTDVAMIILIASVSVVVAFFTAKAIFGDTYDGKANVKTIEKIDSSIVQPSSKIFNKDAINPTVQVEINSSSTTPDVATD